MTAFIYLKVFEGQLNHWCLCERDEWFFFKCKRSNFLKSLLLKIRNSFVKFRFALGLKGGCKWFYYFSKYNWIVFECLLKWDIVSSQVWELFYSLFPCSLTSAFWPCCFVMRLWAFELFHSVPKVSLHSNVKLYTSLKDILRIEENIKCGHAFCKYFFLKSLFFLNTFQSIYVFSNRNFKVLWVFLWLNVGWFVFVFE